MFASTIELSSTIQCSADFYARIMQRDNPENPHNLAGTRWRAAREVSRSHRRTVLKKKAVTVVQKKAVAVGWWIEEHRLVD